MITFREAFHPNRKQLSGFGYVSVPGFALIGFLATRLGASMTVFWILLGVGGLMLLATLLASRVPALLDWVVAPVYRLMIAITFPLGLAISFILLGLIYYLLFTPVALWFKVIGRDKMNRRLDRAAPSYWRERGPARAPATYLRMH